MRRSSSILIIVLSCLALGFVSWHLTFELPAAAAQSAQSPELVRTSNPAPRVAKPGDPPALVTSVAPPGSAMYVAKRGDTVPLVAHHFLSQTSFLTSSELADAIRKASGNPQGTYLKSGQELIVPGILPAPIVEKTVPVPRDFEVRAVYLTGVMAASDRGLRIIRRWRELGGNAVVFDVKDSDGSVNIPFDHPLAGGHHIAIHDLPKFTHFLHSQGMHAIARVAIFRDERLVVAHPELAVKSHRDRPAWRENGKLVWTDPSQPKVQEYDIALAKKAAEAGVDEVQFDYVRFPAEGDQKDASFVFQTDTSDVASLRRDCRLPQTCLRRTASHRRAAFAGRVWHYGLAAAGRFGAHRAGYRADGKVLRRALADDLSLALLRHGRDRASRRRAGTFYRRIHEAL